MNETYAESLLLSITLRVLKLKVFMGTLWSVVLNMSRRWWRWSTLCWNGGRRRRGGVVVSDLKIFKRELVKEKVRIYSEAEDDVFDQSTFDGSASLVSDVTNDFGNFIGDSFTFGDDTLPTTCRRVV